MIKLPPQRPYPPICAQTARVSSSPSHRSFARGNLAKGSLTKGDPQKGSPQKGDPWRGDPGKSALRHCKVWQSRLLQSGLSLLLLLSGLACGPSVSAQVFHDVLRTSSLQVVEQAASQIPSTEQPQPFNSQQQLRVTLTAMGRDFSMQLFDSPINRDTRYLDTYLSPLDTAAVTAYNDNVRLLSGTVLEDDASWVRLTLSEGLLTGYIKAFGELLKIERTSSIRDAGLNLDNASPTVMTRSPDLTQIGLSEIPIDPLARAPAAQESTALQGTGSAPASLHRIDGIAVPRAIRIGIVVDSLFDEHHRNRGVEHALSLIHAVDGIYQEQLGIAIVLEYVRVSTDPLSDPMRNSGGTIEEILENFRQVRIEDPGLPADLTLVHLFTGLRDPESVIGLGWINTACRVDGYDVSVSTPFAFDVLLAAHEMAHNLGALHDDDPSCQTDRSHIMWPRLSSHTQPGFSQCSKDSIAPNAALSCNLDNIDLSAGLLSAPGQSDNMRSVTLLLRNNDPARVAGNVATLARFPTGSRIIDAPGFCLSAGLQLRCQYGNLAAATTTRAIVSVALASNTTAQWVQLETLAAGFADVSDRNNTVVLDIQSFGSTDTVAPSEAGFADDAAQSPALDDQAIATSDTSGGSSGDAIGAMNLSFLWLLAICWLRDQSRRRTHNRNQPTDLTDSKRRR